MSTGATNRAGNLHLACAVQHRLLRHPTDAGRDITLCAPGRLCCAALIGDAETSEGLLGNSITGCTHPASCRCGLTEADWRAHVDPTELGRLVNVGVGSRDRRHVTIVRASAASNRAGGRSVARKYNRRMYADIAKSVAKVDNPIRVCNLQSRRYVIVVLSKVDCGPSLDAATQGRLTPCDPISPLRRPGVSVEEL